MHGRVPIKASVKQSPAVIDPDAIDLRQLQDFFWRRWKVILSTAATVCVLTFLTLLTVAPRYTATVQVLLDPRKEKLFANEATSPEPGLDTSKVDSQIAVIQSTNLLYHVVEKEKLADDTEFGGSAKPGTLRTLLAKIWRPAEPAANGQDDDPRAAIPPQLLPAITRLRNALDVQRINRTYVLSIAVTSHDPEKASRLANAVGDAFVLDQLEARYDTARRASGWFAERMDGLRDQVRQSEEAVADFRRKNNLATATSEGKVTVTEQQMSELNGKIAATRADTAEKKAKYEQAQQVQGQGGNIEAVPDVVRSPVISRLREQQAEAAGKEAILIARYGSQYPAVVNARAERRDMETSISKEVARIISNLKNDYEVAKTREASLQASLTQLTGETGSDNSIGVQLRALERNNAANKTLFENFLSRAKITQEQSTFEDREARIISPATKPAAPSFPNTRLFEAVALILGLGLGVAGAVALDLLNSGFVTAAHIEDRLGVPVLASVPLLKDAERTVDGKVLSLPKYLAKKPLSRFAESVRAVRMGVQMSDVDRPAKVVLVTSSVPQEGKTTLSICLALSAAKAGQRVLLLDGDLRHPNVSRFFGLEGKAGLVDLLAGAATPRDIMVESGGIAILGSGSKSTSPADLLGSDRMKSCIERLRTTCDYVVIDSPPVGPVIDAKVLAALVDKVIFVVRWQKTTREVVSQNLETIMSERKVAGIVLNLVDESKIPRFGPYAQYLGHYYKDYYQS